MSIRIAVLSLGFLLAAPCFAKEATIGQTSIALTAPAGQCELDRNQPSDAARLEVTEKAVGGVGNRLLALYADCKQLTDLRSGKRALMEDFAQYQASLATADAPAPAVTADAIKQLCNQQREESEWGSVGLAEVVRGIKVDQLRLLGVVGEDTNACYAALVQRFKAKNGKDVTLVALFATTFVKGKLIYYYLYSPYRSAQTVSALLAKQKLNVAALLAANKQ